MLLLVRGVLLGEVSLRRYRSGSLISAIGSFVIMVSSRSFGLLQEGDAMRVCGDPGEDAEDEKTRKE